MTVKELLTSPEKWTRGESARDINGRPVMTDSKEAVSWCLVGALMKCYRGSKVAYLRTRIGNLLQISVEGWNDDPNRKFEDVKALVEQLDI